MATAAGYSEEDLEVLEAEFTRLIERSITDVCVATAEQIHGAVVADASSASLGPQDVAVVTQLWSEQVDGVLVPYVAEVYTGSAAQVAIGVADAFPDDLLPGVPLVPDQYAVTYMKSVSNRLVGVGDELWEDVRNELLDGIAQGQSVPQIRDRIKAVANFTERRSTVIARTEIHGAAETGNVAQMRYMGYEDDEVEKEWVATIGDGRTRLTHIKANGQRVGLDEKFTVGGWKLDHPGDILGPPDEIIQCRCTTIFNFTDAPKFRCDGAVTAATTPDGAEFCIIPTALPNITHLLAPIAGKGATSIAQLFFNAYMKHKITPAYGGAKIQKVLELTRADMDVNYPGMLDGVSDQELLAAVDHYYVAKKDTFFGKWFAWTQTPAGKKVVGKVTPVKAVKSPVTPASPSAPPKLGQLPPVPAKPDPAQLTFTGKTLGSHGAQVWVDADGNKWLFKPQSDFMSSIDVATAQLQSKALQTRPGVYKITLNGKSGSIQSMFQSKDAFPGGFTATSLSPTDALTLQRAHIFDWLIGNHDAHSGQFVRLSDGTLIDVDKGQAFKFLGKDKLDWDYTPPGNVGTPVYNLMWRAYVQGKDVPLIDPTTGELGAFIDNIMAIPDAEYRDLFRAYATGRGLSGKQLDDFLDQVVARKNSLKDDFTLFWQRAVDARAKSLGVTTPPPVVAPTVTPVPLGSVDLVDISQFSSTYKSDVLEMWVAQGGGKKVTPAWGGAKIYKMLVDLQDGVKSSGMPPATHAQLLRILDEQGGFKGKPKTYESVVREWLDTPASSKVTLKVGLPDESLKKVPVTLVKPPGPPVPVSVVTPSTSSTDEAFAVIQLDDQTTPGLMFADLPKYQDGEVIGYTLTKSGIYLRATKQHDGGIQVSVFKDGEWKYDTTFTSDVAHLFETEYDLGPYPTWYATTPKASITKTIVHGKLPGDVAFSHEIEELRYLWKKNDVIATSSLSGHKYRLSSDGEGGVDLHVMYSETSVWLHLDHWSPDLALPDNFGLPPSAGWKYSGDVLVSKKPSAFEGYNEGDHIGLIDVQTVSWQQPPNTVIAYGYNPTTIVEYRMKVGYGSTTELQIRQLGTTKWLDAGTMYTPSDMVPYSGFTWRVAKANGDAPDEHIAQLPGQTKVPGKTPTKIPSMYDGDEVSVTEFATFADQFNDYEIIALGKQGDWEWRIYSIDGVYVREVRNLESASGWVFDGIVENIQQPSVGWATNVTWHASTGKVTPSSLGAKQAKTAVSAKGAAAKKAAKKVATKAAPVTPSPPTKKILYGSDTHIPGKSVGDVITKQEIIDNLGKYVDGQVIAVAPSMFNAQRLLVMDGHLVKQEQTAAGAWKTVEVWKLKDADYYVSKYMTWKASNDILTKPQTNAVKKAIAKKYPTAGLPPTPSKAAAAKSTSGSTPNVGPPVQLQHVDIDQWDSTQQNEIYQYFKSQGGTYVSGQPQTIWGAVQAIKSHFQTKYKGKYLNLNEIEILRIVDRQSAIKYGVPDTHPFETKIVNWLKTPAGKAWINKRIDAPIAATDVPRAMSALDDPSNPDPDKQSYQVITLSQARQYREESHKKYGTWKPGEKEAQKTYTGGSYTAWNAAIRSGDLGSYRAKIRAATLGARPSTRPMLLHRGTGFAELNDPSITSYETLLAYVGRTYTARGFTSTSVGGHAAFHGQLLIEVEAPIGTPMTHVADFSNYKSENETTLPPHLIYQIMKVTKVGGTTHMRVRVIGVADPSA